MATLRCIVALDPARLLECASRDLFPLTPSSPERPWPTIGSWVVLRQGGLRDDFHALAASRGVVGWFDPPVCLFAEMSSRWQGDSNAAGNAPLSAQERIALLSTLLERHGSSVFGGADRRNVDAWVPAADRLIGDLVSEGITPDAFQAALDARTGRDSFETRRDAVLGALHRDWCATLARLGRTDGRDARVRLAQDIARDPAGFAERLGGRRDMRIIGLADLRGGWRALLSALAATPALDSVTVFASHAIALSAGLAVETVHETSGARSVMLAESLFLDATATAHCLEMVETPDAIREIEIVATRVRALIDGGVSPRRIAVVARQERPMVDDMAACLDAVGVPVTARRRVALAGTAPAIALRALLSLGTESWSRHAVLETAEHPLLGLGLDGAVLDLVGRAAPLDSFAKWTDALASLLVRCRMRDADARHDRDSREWHALPATDRVERTLSAWRAWAPQAARIDAERTPAEWFSWVEDVLDAPGWGVRAGLRAVTGVDAESAGVQRIEWRAVQQLATVAASWRHALDAFGASTEPIDAGRFAVQLALALDEDLVIQPETGFGVVVSEALAAGWRSFDHLFVVGLAAGNFPSRPPSSPLFDDADRRALVASGLPLDPPDAWRERERELFRVLCAAPRERLTLSWPAMDSEGREVARSSYVDESVAASMRVLGIHTEADLVRAGVLVSIPTEQVLTPSFPIVARASGAAMRGIVEHGQRAAAIERERSHSLSPWNGAITDPVLVAELARRFGEDYTWSATSIEELAKCPWSWMSRRLLRLEERGEADDAIEPTVSGRILHAALDRFFAHARREKGDPVFLRSDDLGWCSDAIAEALDAAWDTEGVVSWLGAPALRHVVKAELLQSLTGYLAFEVDYNERTFNNKSPVSRNVRTGVTLGEYTFDDVTIDIGGVRFRLRGTIDRVDRGVDTRVKDAPTYLAAIDYKSTKYSTPAAGNAKGWEDGVVLQVPLYAEVLRQKFPGETLTRLEYRTLRKPQVVHALQFTKLEKPAKPDKADKDGRVVVEVPEAEARFQNALAAAALRVSAARDGEFPAGPAPSCGCSPYCAARDVCRIPGGPVSTGFRR